MPKMVGEGSARERVEKVMMARSKGRGWNLGIARLNHMTKSLLSDRLFHLSANKFPTGFEKQTVHYWYFIERYTELFLNINRHPSVSLSWHPEALSRRAVSFYIALLYST